MSETALDALSAEHARRQVAEDRHAALVAAIEALEQEMRDKLRPPDPEQWADHLAALLRAAAPEAT